jgi:hypothetical protein
LWKANLSLAIPSPSSSSDPTVPPPPQSEQQSHPTLPFARRRVGRGGRLLFDRHVRRRDWIPSFVYSRDDNVSEEERSRWEAIAERWRYDNSDDDFSEDEDLVMVMQDNAS